MALFLIGRAIKKGMDKKKEKDAMKQNDQFDPNTFYQGQNQASSGPYAQQSQMPYGQQTQSPYPSQQGPYGQSQYQQPYRQQGSYGPSPGYYSPQSTSTGGSYTGR